MPAVALRRPFVAVIALAVLLAGCSKEEAKPQPQQRPAPEVVVQTVVPRDIPFTPTFVAQTESSQQVNIVARVSGFLDKIAYQEGDFVKEGQLLFQLDPKPFQAQLEAARGELQAQQARFTTSQANLGRVKPLAQENALSQADLDKAQGEFDSAKAAVFAAQAKVKEAELNLGYATIRSPVNGLASRALQRQGAFVNATSDSANLTYVAAIDPIWVNFSVSQTQAARTRELIQTKQIVAPRNQDYVVELLLSDGTPYPHQGKINFADPSFSQDTGSFLVRAVLPNPNTVLRPGMFVTAIVKGSIRPNAIVVPQLAVQQGSNGHLVYVVKDDGTVEVRPVIVGEYVGEKEIVIVSGLIAGDRVVVEGVLKVVPGQPVKVAETRQQPSPASATPAAQVSAAPTVSPATASSEVPATAPSAAPTAAPRAATPAPSPPSPRGAAASAATDKGVGPGSYGPTKRGETLTGIAMQVKPANASLEQTIVGIFHANPDAFTTDPHRLRAGVILRIPTSNELAAVDRAAAAEELRRATELWRAGHVSPTR
jgi:membrane fusion protein, multidrug efflux system